MYPELIIKTGAFILAGKIRHVYEKSQYLADDTV